MLSKILQLTIVSGSVFLLSASCKKDESPSQFLVNSNVEDGYSAPTGWERELNGVVNVRWANEASTSPSHSLKINIDNADVHSYGSWKQTFYGPLKGNQYTLRVKIKGENITGSGVTIGIFCANPTSGGQDATSLPILGTFDWTTYSIKITDLLANVNSTSVSLTFNANTQGTVYFDDITLTVN
jgi:hypothetical protein